MVLVQSGGSRKFLVYAGQGIARRFEPEGWLLELKVVSGGAFIKSPCNPNRVKHGFRVTETFCVQVSRGINLGVHLGLDFPVTVAFSATL